MVSILILNSPLYSVISEGWVCLYWSLRGIAHLNTPWIKQCIIDEVYITVIHCFHITVD